MSRFKVDDLYKLYRYESKSLKYVRKINEGGYVKTKRVLINQTIVFWLKIIKIETKNFCYSEKYQDISAFYYLRNYPNIIK
jgi:hypothetical protein